MLRYILRGIWYYRGVNLSVMLAVAVSTSVIAGALIVGDSVRTSLRAMSLERLGGIHHVLHSPRFLTQDLSGRLAADAAAGDSSVVAPALLMTGSVERQGEQNDSLRRAGSVIVLGVESAGWSLLDTGDLAIPEDRGIVLGSRTADELGAAVGDEVSLWIELPSSIPRDSLLGERDELVREIVVTVSGILDETNGASRFSLNPSQQFPYNAFVSLALLQDRLGLEAVDVSRRTPIAKPARINTVLVGDTAAADDRDFRRAERVNASRVADSDQAAAERLNTGLGRQLSLADVRLRLRLIAERGYLSAESDSMILEDPIADAVQAAAEQLGMTASPVQVYLANEIWAAEREDPESRYSMYSIVAGVEVDAPPPLGPFRLQDGSPAPTPAADEVLLSAWLAEDLEVTKDDLVEMRWHEIGSHGDLPEVHRRFRVRGVLSANDSHSVDPGLTPQVEGVTDADNFRDWDQPFEMNLDRITSRDDDYWSAYRATPKAFLAPETANEIWNSRYGTWTSVRVAAPGGPMPEPRLEELRERLETEIPQQLSPAELGLAFRPVRLEGLRAAVGANDFTGLFLGFSGFLILSAILLASLMFQLGIQQRIRQVGLLEAVGLSRGTSRCVFLGEGVLVACAGCVLGAAAGVGFAQLMIHGLTTWWVGAVGTRFLRLDVQPMALIIAAVGTLAVAGLVIWVALVRMTRRPPRELLAGISADDDAIDVRERRSGTWRQIAFDSLLLVAVALPVAGILDVVPGSEAAFGLTWQVIGFFVAGLAWLAAGILLLGRQLNRRRGETITDGTRASLTRLAVANASRRPWRSLLTTSLIAFATFVIVAVAAAHRNPAAERPDRQSGNGGFTLVAESSQPVLFDLNSQEGRSRLGLGRSEATTLPDEVTVHGFSLRPGQDASCLNLYQTAVPTLLGAQPDFLERGGFRFANTPGDTPWMTLQESLPDVDGLPAIPVIGDMNTLQFSLKKGIGDVILFPDASAPQYALQVVGMLDGSIFQGVLVMTDDNLKRIAPEVTGRRWFLVESGTGQPMEQTAEALETALAPFGLDTEPVSQRLAGFLAVQNTYLSTFQMLGGLGLIVGTIGLAAVMLRNVLERRSEIALMLAVGFTRARVLTLIAVENTLLLFWGMLTGAAAALVAMLPHLLSTGADVRWPLLGLTLGGVLLVGSISVVLPVRAAARTSVRESLAAG